MLSLEFWTKCFICQTKILDGAIDYYRSIQGCPKLSQSIKVGLCQINPILGDFDYNYNKILDSYNEAIKHNCELVVFPEMVVTGYPPQDLLLSDKFIDKNLSTLNDFVKHVSKTCILG